MSKALFEKWQGRGTVYTDKQIRTTVDELHGRGLFARATYGRRLTYFSNKLVAEKLREAIFAKHTKVAQVANEQSQADTAMTANIRQVLGNSGATHGQLQ